MDDKPNNIKNKKIKHDTIKLPTIQNKLPYLSKKSINSYRNTSHQLLSIHQRTTTKANGHHTNTFQRTKTNSTIERQRKWIQKT